MRKAGAAVLDSGAANFRSIPSVERLLSSPELVPLVTEFGRERVKVAVVAHLDDVRKRRVQFDEQTARIDVAARVMSATSPTLRRVINATGVLIHTNLGRSPVDPTVWSDAEEIVSGYANLEFDLASGERGKRDEHLSALCASLFGCEAAILTNNNAAGTLLLLAATAAKKEVIVSRGELVEIGGAFRVPDVIQQGGAKLREVGTTNRTRARDYAEAVTKKTAAILRVHRSNFDIVGFTETPSVDELVVVSREKKVPILYDEGSGRVVDLSRYGFERAATIRELIASGVDAITCSTDKLIGATQGGLILGRADIVNRCRKHPHSARAARGEGVVRDRRRDAARIRDRQARGADPDLPHARHATRSAARARRGDDARHGRDRHRQRLRPRRRHHAGGDDPVDRDRGAGQRERALRRVSAPGHRRPHRGRPLHDRGAHAAR